VVPFVFAYNAALLMEGSPGFIILSFITAFVGTITLSAAMENYLFTSFSWLNRVAFFAGSILLLISDFWTDVAGAVILAVGIIANYRADKMTKSVPVRA